MGHKEYFLVKIFLTDGTVKELKNVYSIVNHDTYTEFFYVIKDKDVSLNEIVTNLPYIAEK